MEEQSPPSAGLATPRWVDPRDRPRPPASPTAVAPAVDPAELLPLVGLCAAGRIYEIERWIRAGKPIQASAYEIRGRRRVQSPLLVAVDHGLPDVALLLLCNGYRLDLEPAFPLESALDKALQRRAWDLVDLLLEWGADPKRVDPENVFDTYRTGLIDRFWDAGLDYTKSHALAWYLSEHSSNRPLYGWVRRRLEDARIARELDLALGEAVWEGAEKVVLLLLWAGADPRARVPRLRYLRREQEDDEDAGSAIEGAVAAGRAALLKALKPDPARDDFGALYESVTDVETLKYLLGIRPPEQWTPIILANIYRLSLPYDLGRHAKECLDFVATQGGNLGALTPATCADVRRSLLNILDDEDFRRLMSWLADPACCDPTTYAEITRTPALKSRLRKSSRRASW